MKLPNREAVWIDDAKITAYLLSEENSNGKATFFIAFGFTITDWEQLRDALRQHAADHEVKSISETVHGVKYIIEGGNANTGWSATTSTLRLDYRRRKRYTPVGHRLSLSRRIL